MLHRWNSSQFPRKNKPAHLASLEERLPLHREGELWQELERGESERVSITYPWRFNKDLGE